MCVSYSFLCCYEKNRIKKIEYTNHTDLKDESIDNI